MTRDPDGIIREPSRSPYRPDEVVWIARADGRPFDSLDPRYGVLFLDQKDALGWVQRNHPEGDPNDCIAEVVMTPEQMITIAQLLEDRAAGFRSERN